MEKTTFKVIFALLAISLLLLPFITTFNEFLTRVVMRFEIYRLIQNFIVPLEIKFVVALLKLLRIEAYPTFTAVGLGRPNIIGNSAEISWNCIGWQSFILMLITLVTGLQGNHRLWGKIQTILIGTLGTFLLNILRITLVIVIAYRLNQDAAIVFHDYFSTFLIILWLFFFWWFTYSFVLEEERGDLESLNSAQPR